MSLLFAGSSTGSLGVIIGVSLHKVRSGVRGCCSDSGKMAKMRCRFYRGKKTVMGRALIRLGAGCFI